MADKKDNASVPASPWESGRKRFGLRQLWRGGSRKWYFSGQQPGEEVRLVVRKHWWFIIGNALPALGSFIVFLAILWASTALPGWGTFWYVLGGAALLSTIGFGIWYAYHDLVAWWFESYIITNKRIINARGLLQPTRQETPVDKIQQIGIDIKSFLGLLLGFGDLHLYLAGGDLIMKEVPFPKRVKDELMSISSQVNSKKPAPPPPVSSGPKDPALVSVLGELSQGKSVKPLPNADENLPQVRLRGGFIGPRRTFGGILRIPCDVRYVSGEYTVKYIQRSRYVLWRKMFVPVALLIVIVPVAIIVAANGTISGPFLQFWWSLLALLVLVLLGSMALVYMNYVDDVYILTTRRIIDIQRHFIFFNERRIETEYKNIRDIKVKVPNVIERFLDVGDVFVETPGNNPDIILNSVDHPFILQDEIIGIKGHKDREDSARRENAEKENLKRWFTQVLGKLEDTMKTRGAPNLKDMDLLTAIACAQEYGFDVTVLGEEVTTSNATPGLVIRQNPPAGTLMSANSQVEVVLSKRPSLVDQV